MGEAILKIENGQVYGWNDGGGLSGLGEGKWDWIGPVGVAVGGAVATWLGRKTQAQYPVDPRSGVVSDYSGSGGGQWIKGVDNSVLLIGAVGALLFMYTPKGR